MMDKAQILLRAAGCPKINLQVRRTNAIVIEFYKKIGYKLDARKLAPVMLTLGGLHTQFIGEILDVKVAQDMLDEAGNADIRKIKPIIFSPVSQRYHGVGPFLGKAFSIGGKLK